MRPFSLLGLGRKAAGGHQQGWSGGGREEKAMDPIAPVGAGPSLSAVSARQRAEAGWVVGGGSGLA